MRCPGDESEEDNRPPSPSFQAQQQGSRVAVREEGETRTTQPECSVEATSPRESEGLGLVAWSLGLEAGVIIPVVAGYLDGLRCWSLPSKPAKY